MKKNKLYTANKWNKPLFTHKFAYGGDEAYIDRLASEYYGADYGFNGNDMNSYLNTKNSLGISKRNNPFSKVNIGNTVGGLGSTIGGVAGNAIRGDFDDGGVGSSIQNIGGQIGSAIPGPIGGIVSLGTGIIGGLFSRMFGVKENKENTNFIKQNTSNAINTGNVLASSSDNMSLVNNSSKMVGGSGFHWGDLYQNGWFTSKGTRLGNNLIAKENTGLAIQNNGLATGADNIDTNMDRNALRNFAAFGGPLGYFGTGALGIMQNDKYLDAINNRSDAIAKSSPFNASYNGLAFGGELGTNGTDFTNGLLYVDEGGSHEENPLGGIPMGVDDQGIPNLVEEDETVFNDYVFSNRMKVPKAFYNELGLGGALNKKGITFAEASKKLAKESEQRPNDPISQDGLEDSMNRLAAIQEAERMKKAAKEYRESEFALGGNLFGKGSSLRHNNETALEWLKKNYPDVRNRKELADALANIYEKNYLKTSQATDAKTGKTIDISSPTQYASWGNAYRMLTHGSGNIIRTNWRNGSIDEKKANKHYKELLSYGLNPKIAFGIAYPMPEKPKEGYGPSYMGKQTKAYEDAVKRRNELYGEMLKGDYTSWRKSSQAPTPEELSQTKEEQPVQNQQVEKQKPETKNGNAKTKQGTAKAPSAKTPTTTTEEPYNPIPFGGDYIQPSANPLMDYLNAVPETTYEAAKNYNGDMATYTEVPSTALEQNEYVLDPNRTQETLKQTTPEEDYKPYPTWMRYAPAVGSGIMSLSDMLGLTNTPDYTEAQKIENAADRAANFLPATFTPNGDYLRYDPMDIWSAINRQNANSRATDRVLSDTSNPARMAGILANSYNNQIATGDLFAKGLEYNNANRARTADFNRRTNMFNSQMGLEAAMANSRTRQQAEATRLSGIAQAAAMRDNIDTRMGAARSANLSNFLNSLGNIGRENFIMNQINGDDAWRYGVDNNGYTPLKRKRGGKINKR